ncbi:MAG: thiamine pyrophosphate-dependent enzyme, partial [Clostridiales bacterium]
KYTKAGAKICMDQHRDLIARLDAAEKKLHADGMHKIQLGEKGKLGIITVGVTTSFMAEALELVHQAGLCTNGVSILNLAGSHPAAHAEFSQLLDTCCCFVVLEENEPYVEKALYLDAYKADKHPHIYGKEDGTLSRIGNFNAMTCAAAIAKALGGEIKADTTVVAAAEALCSARPIGVCAGCPHRGVYMSLNAAVKKLGYKKNEVMITGDIGCTILGMSPPFHTLWTEVAMGASVAMAQGFVHAGIETPVFSTMGDSTFLHAGMPPLVNAIQQNTPITAIIMDNGWTAMTGMQVNANTAVEYQQNDHKTRVDVVDVVKGLGVKQLFIVDPYDLDAMTNTLVEAAKLPGVKVVVARRECAIQAGRRKIKYGVTNIDQDKCVNCKICINTTGCPGLVFDGKKVFIDHGQCNGCGICTFVCPKKAIIKEEC